MEEAAKKNGEPGIENSTLWLLYLIVTLLLLYLRNYSWGNSNSSEVHFSRSNYGKEVCGVNHLVWAYPVISLGEYSHSSQMQCLRSNGCRIPEVSMILHTIAPHFISFGALEMITQPDSTHPLTIILEDELAQEKNVPIDFPQDSTTLRDVREIDRFLPASILLQDRLLASGGIVAVHILFCFCTILLRISEMTYNPDASRRTVMLMEEVVPNTRNNPKDSSPGTKTPHEDRLMNQLR